MTDPIADMLNRLETAQAAKKETAEIPFSQEKYAIAKILESKGFVKNVGFKGKRSRRVIDIGMRYEEGVPRIGGVKRVSKPGQRVYVASQEIKRVKNGRGISIVSTSKGLMTGQEAIKTKIGGELLCEVWG